MKILFFGDIVGKPGRKAIQEVLPIWQKKYAPDLIMANGENLAHGLGVTQKTLKEMLGLGIDCFTSGDHILDKKEAKTLLEKKNVPLIRPANLPNKTPGQGYWLTQIRTKKVSIINLLGQTFIDQKSSNPFKKIDKMLEQERDGVDIVILDFHAEATSEKVCMGWHLDGRVSAVLGTHTHIPTADARVLPQGTAYITDVGMVGVRYSSLGIEKNLAIKGFLEGKSPKKKIAKGPVEVNAVLIQIDNQNQARKIEKLQKIVDI